MNIQIVTVSVSVTNVILQ